MHSVSYELKVLATKFAFLNSLEFQIEFELNLMLIEICIEPVGSVAPKSSSLETKTPRVPLGESLGIIASVQGYPVPSYL